MKAATVSKPRPLAAETKMGTSSTATRVCPARTRKLTAGVDAAFGAFDEAAANYRLTVLNAFRDVEDQLAQINGFAQEAADRDSAVAAAARTNQLALTRYNEGAASFLEVVTAQTAELDARRTALTLNTQRLQAAVDLIRAMGGGWVEQRNVAQNTP